MKVKMRKLNKKILSVVTVVCMLFTCMLSMKDAFAEESISIYNHSYGEVLKKISPEYYETLNDNVKEYLDCPLVTGLMKSLRKITKIT